MKGELSRAIWCAAGLPKRHGGIVMPGVQAARVLPDPGPTSFSGVQDAKTDCFLPSHLLQLRVHILHMLHSFSQEIRMSP